MKSYCRFVALIAISSGLANAAYAQSSTAAASFADAGRVDATGSTPRNAILVFKLDPAGRSTCGAGRADDIVVCRKSDERYRLPDKPGFDPNGPVDSVLRERSRLLEGGESGTHSCNFVVGAGSWTGCELKAMERARQQGRSVSRFGDIHLGRR